MVCGGSRLRHLFDTPYPTERKVKLQIPRLPILLLHGRCNCGQVVGFLCQVQLVQTLLLKPTKHNRMSYILVRVCIVSKIVHCWTNKYPYPPGFLMLSYRMRFPFLFGDFILYAVRKLVYCSLHLQHTTAQHQQHWQPTESSAWLFSPGAGVWM